MATLLLDRKQNSFSLLIAPDTGMSLTNETTARLALDGPVRLLDCGNRSNVYPITKMIRRLTKNVNTTLDHILISRAFTCYQVVALLKHENSQAPVIVLDLLSTFLDESVNSEEANRLLDCSIIELKRLCLSAPVLVTSKTPSDNNTNRASLTEKLVRSAASIYQIENSARSVLAETQASLF